MNWSRDVLPGCVDAAAASIADAGSGADFVYLPAVETSDAMVRHWDRFLTATGLRETTGRAFVRLEDGTADAKSWGIPEGFSIQAPDLIERAASGNVVQVRVVARAAAGAAAARFAIAYSTNDVGNSGWRWFTAGPEWAVHQMQYAVPTMKNGNGDFIGILADAAGTPGVDICAAVIVVRQFEATRKNIAALASAARVDRPLAEVLTAIQTATATSLPYLSAAYGSERLAKAILLKIANLALLRTQYVRHHSNLIAKPIAFLVDPANACQLRCPGCIHGDARKGKVLWDKNLLDATEFDSLIGEFGPYSIVCQFFNWGEPLINRQLPQMIKMAQEYLMSTRVHTNLSLSFDIKAVVASGLEFLTLSVDGVSQSILETYRRGARAQLIFDNIKRLVDEKARLNSYTPYLHWKYIMFDHNIGEIAEAEELAKELGINQISFVTPYQVDDPKITADNLPEPRKVVFHNDLGKMWNAHQQSARALSPDIDEAFDNFMALEVKPEHSRSAARNKCHWLYEQTVMDAGGRILPCCGAPMKETWIFADRVAAGVFNNEKYISARELGDGAETACHTCPVVDGSRLPNVHAPEAFPHFLRGMDWLGLLPIDQLQPLWDYAPDRAEA